MHRYIFRSLLSGTLLAMILCMTGRSSTDSVRFNSFYHKLLFAQETPSPHTTASINVGPELAGRYHAGYGVFLLITTNYGFDFSSGTCFPEQGNHGIVTATNGLVYLAPKWHPRPGLSNRLEKVLIPIRWGERKYLVAQAKIPNFVRSIENGEEPRQDLTKGDFLLRYGDEKKPALGMPEIPIEATITKAEGRPGTELFASGATTVRARVTLNVGRANGVMPDMRFLFPDMENSPQIFIEEVYDNHSVGFITHHFNHYEKWEPQGSKVIHKEREPDEFILKLKINFAESISWDSNFDRRGL